MSRLSRILLLLPLLGGASPVLGQDGKSHLGLAAVGAIGLHAGYATLQRSIPGGDLGAQVDLGYLRSPRVRLTAELEFLRGELREFVPDEGRTFDGPIYDMSGSVLAVFMGGGPTSRAVPYFQTGLSMHALSSSLGTLLLDERYNTNNFGLVAGTGIRFWLGREGRQGLFVEGRYAAARNVSRAAVRLGFLLFQNDLIRPRRD